MKFKKGDVLIWVKGSDTGSSLKITKASRKDDAYYWEEFPVKGREHINSPWILEEMCEFEHVYNSPLYKALA